MKTPQQNSALSIEELWRRYDTMEARLSAPLSERMLELAGLRSGMRVLDLATGRGEPAVRAAHRVGPSGVVVGIDTSASMLAMAKEGAEREGIVGRIRPHHRFLLKLHLDQIEGLEDSIDTVDTEVGSTIEPFRAKVARLVTMPGISDVAAEVLISEIGVDMTRVDRLRHHRRRQERARRRHHRQRELRDPPLDRAASPRTGHEGDHQRDRPHGQRLPLQDGHYRQQNQRRRLHGRSRLRARAMGQIFTLGIPAAGPFQMFIMPGITIHAKTTLIDDQCAIIGSANAMRRSLFTDVEHSVVFVDTGTAVTDYRAALWSDHFRHPTASDFSDIDASLHAWNAAWGTAGAAPRRPRHIIQLPLPLPSTLTPDMQVLLDAVLDVDSRQTWGGITALRRLQAIAGGGGSP